MNLSTILPHPLPTVQVPRLRRLLVATAVFCLAATAGPGGVCRASNPTSGLDQSYPAPGAAAYVIGQVTSPSPALVEQAQTFTVGASGFLTGLNVQVSIFDHVPGTTTDDLVVSLWTTAGGVPSASLASVHVPATSVPSTGFLSQPAWVGVDLSSFNVLVSPGQMLAVVVDSTAVVDPSRGYYWLAGNSAVDYSAGSAWGHTVGFSWHQDSFDFGFQDFVTPVPELSPVALSFLGVLCLLASSWVRQTQKHSPRGRFRHTAVRTIAERLKHHPALRAAPTPGVHHFPGARQ